MVAVDASVGDENHIGYVTLGRGSLKPGLGVCKELHAVGDLFITGIVGGLQPLRSDDAAEYPPGTRHAAGRLHQRRGSGLSKIFAWMRPPFDKFCMQSAL